MKIDTILYRTQKDKKLADFETGAIAAAIAADLLRNGIKDANRFVFGASKADDRVKKIKTEVKSAEASKKTAKPAAGYAYVGIAGKDLVCQIRDSKNESWEDNTVMLKDYVGERNKRKNATVAVLDVHDEDDDAVETATANLAAGRGVTSQIAEKAGDAALGDITGDVVMCAHGTPSASKGRVIGIELGGKSASQIVDILTASKDKSKRIPKSYSGKITLVGCFTAAGGPTAAENAADQPFAANVRAELSKRGYKNVAVIGMPGPVNVSAGGGDKDDHGTKRRQGDTGTRHADESEDALDALQKRIDGNIEKLNQAQDNWKGTPEAFDAHPKVKELIASMKKDSADMARVAQNLKDRTDASKSVTSAGRIKDLTGYFGPEKYKSKPWYKRLFK